MARGGGLIVLGETEEAKYGSNLNELLEPFGIRFENTTVFDHTHFRDTPTWVTRAASRKRRPPASSISWTTSASTGRAR